MDAHDVRPASRRSWRGRKRYAFALGLLTIAVGASVAAATPPSNFVGTILTRGTASDRAAVIEPRISLSLGRIAFGDPVVNCGPARNCDVVVQTVIAQPGGTSGWHSHPGLVSVVVRSGAVTRYEADRFGHGCSSNIYSVGQAFLELGSDHIALVRNHTTQVAELTATYIVPAGAPLRIDQPAPAGCSVQG